MGTQLHTVEKLKKENKRLLEELAIAYNDMEMILQKTEREKEIAYKELEHRYHSLQLTYGELSKKENMLIHLEKLSAIGQFITEIVHELNNPLAIISGIAEVVLLEDIPEQMRKKLNNIPEQVERMSDYLSRFKAMAYKSKESFEHFDLSEKILDFIDTIEIIRPKNINIIKNLHHEPLPVHGDPHQLNQIYLNLTKNAFDAMDKNDSTFEIKSKLVASKNVKSENMLGSICSAKKEDWQKILAEFDEFVLIEFKDNGNGVPENLMQDIFKPFFTTKERGKGTGLGLSIATDIAKKHNANLAVKSKSGEGTTFQLVIPLSKNNTEIQNNFDTQYQEQKDIIIG